MIAHWTKAFPLAALLATTLHFAPAAAPAATARLVEGASVSYHNSITNAFDAISGNNSASVQAQAGTFSEDLLLDAGVPVTLTGGLDSSYSQQVGSTLIQGALTIASGSLETDNVVLTSPSVETVRIIYLHHSTGWNIWSGGVPNYISAYNSANGTDYQIEERAYPDSPYPWDNYPYDYWKLWVDTTGATGYLDQDTLDTLTADYDVVVFKHCFPVSDIEADSGSPDITSSRKSIENYQLQYNALKERMLQFPATKFIVWTGAALIQGATTEAKAERARQFFNWVRTTWDESGDNIFVWDFWTLETEGGLYLKPEYAASSGDSHPNATFSATVAPYIGRRIVDVIEGAGDSGSISGTP